MRYHSILKRQKVTSIWKDVEYNGLQIKESRGSCSLDFADPVTIVLIPPVGFDGSIFSCPLVPSNYQVLSPSLRCPISLGVSSWRLEDLIFTISSAHQYALNTRPSSNLIFISCCTSSWLTQHYLTQCMPLQSYKDSTPNALVLIENIEGLYDNFTNISPNNQQQSQSLNILSILEQHNISFQSLLDQPKEDLKLNVYTISNTPTPTRQLPQLPSFSYIANCYQVKICQENSLPQSLEILEEDICTILTQGAHKLKEIFVLEQEEKVDFKLKF